MAEVMTTYATSIYNFVGRRLSWSNNGEQQQRPSSHDLFEGSPRPSWLSNPSTYMLQAPLVSVVDQNDSDIDDAVSEQTLVAVEQIPIVLRRAPIPGAESPARGELAGGISDNSVGSDATASNSPIIPPPDGPISHITPATSLTTTETSIEGTNDTERMRSTALPEDDGQRPLRHLLQEIHNMDIPERERAKRMHLVMTEKYNALKGGNDPSKKIVRSGKADPFELMPGDAEKTYHKDSELGCSHYKRGVKLQCSTCHKWYTCRFCHDENEDHTLIRTETKNMLCMHCGKAQPVGQDCRHCGVKAACYYCDKCKLWDDDGSKSIYHCDDCGICRIGVGLGKDFFHCKKCGVCMSIALQEFHRCIERSTECDCPICGEYMFTSTSTVVFMQCGHSIHHECYYEHMKRSYRCPTCTRTIVNMESHFRQLDIEIAHQPLPPPYDAWRCMISCNDCSTKCNVPFHFLGLKCDECKSYNTSQVKLIRPEDTAPQMPARVVVDPTSLAPPPILERDLPLNPPRGGLRDSTGADTLIAATAVIVLADAAINTVSESRLVYDDGWGSDEGESGDTWSRCGSDKDATSDNEEEPMDELEDALLDDDDDEEDDFLNLTGHR